jgi:hypothetical protein
VAEAQGVPNIRKGEPETIFLEEFEYLRMAK